MTPDEAMEELRRQLPVTDEQWEAIRGQILVARLEAERLTGMPRWRLEQPADELAARRGAKTTRERP